MLKVTQNTIANLPTDDFRAIFLLLEHLCLRASSLYSSPYHLLFTWLLKSNVILHQPLQAVNAQPTANGRAARWSVVGKQPIDQ
jgi:hypothetical protein